MTTSERSTVVFFKYYFRFHYSSTKYKRISVYGESNTMQNNILLYNVNFLRWRNLQTINRKEEKYYMVLAEAFKNIVDRKDRTNKMIVLQRIGENCLQYGQEFCAILVILHQTKRSAIRKINIGGQTTRQKKTKRKATSKNIGFNVTKNNSRMIMDRRQWKKTIHE